MPNTNEYHLYIHGSGGGNKKDPVAGGKTKMTEAEKKEAKFEKAVVGLVSYGTLKGTADKLINFQISQVNLTTGASEYQQRLQTVYDGVSSGADLIHSTILAGKLGGLPLAALNLAIQGTTALLNVAQKSIELSNQKNLEDISINMSAIRAGTRGRRGDNQ